MNLQALGPSAMPQGLQYLSGRILDIDSHEMMPAQVWVREFGPIASFERAPFGRQSYFDFSRGGAHHHGKEEEECFHGLSNGDFDRLDHVPHVTRRIPKCLQRL